MAFKLNHIYTDDPAQPWFLPGPLFSVRRIIGLVRPPWEGRGLFCIFVKVKKRDEKYNVLVNWMKEFFPYAEFKKAGIFTKDMRGNYEAQAEHICRRLGLESIFEYGKEEIRCHITYVNPDCPFGIDSDGRPLVIEKEGKLKAEPFVTVIPSIWDEEKEELSMPYIDGSKYDEDDEEPDDGDAFNPIFTRPPKVKI